MTALSPISPQAVLLSSSLKALCEARREWDFENQDFREAGWNAPAEVDPRDKGEARNNLALALKAAAPADRETVRMWLASLGVMCAGQITAADAKAKIGVYVPNLDHPASCFTKETLTEAGRKFKWFPSYAEIAEFLDAKARPARTLAFRLRKISEAPECRDKPQPGQSWLTMTPDQRREFDVLMETNRSSMRRGMTDEEKRESDQARTEAA